MIMSEYMLLLLAKGINNGGRITVEDAYDAYGNKETARAALIRLRGWGYIQITEVPGVFRLKRAPEEAFEWAENLKNELKPAVVKKKGS